MAADVVFVVVIQTDDAPDRIVAMQLERTSDGYVVDDTDELWVTQGTGVAVAKRLFNAPVHVVFGDERGPGLLRDSLPEGGKQ
jgi:hypothetical protein